ncbi:hypothetical protein NEOLEDRAFT_1128912 [Neolentinus lepideus HHB14362 ss-1]|uniref:Uncharacterized protein n=1 Tax=Neolentinus lepideus HHB14362 ss-1 TaxID=1314782 RepID=A0A165UUM0_9AGAM|nr:hypothetical protein NEOLEDRAFT_1128912 [Neolentinus lepideus HHB14362 ss-1]
MSPLLWATAAFLSLIPSSMARAISSHNCTTTLNDQTCRPDVIIPTPAWIAVSAVFCGLAFVGMILTAVKRHYRTRKEFPGHPNGSNARPPPEEPPTELATMPANTTNPDNARTPSPPPSPAYTAEKLPSYDVSQRESAVEGEPPDAGGPDDSQHSPTRSNMPLAPDFSTSTLPEPSTSGKSTSPAPPHKLIPGS